MTCKDSEQQRLVESFLDGAKIVEACPETIVQLRDADPDEVVCMDERAFDENDSDAQYLRDKNPVNLPGASLVIIDGLAKVLKISEKQARKRYTYSGLPISTHTGHDDLDCGYARAVDGELTRSIVGAPEKVDQRERQEWVREVGGRIPRYTGHHAIEKAVINLRPGTSLDQDQRASTGTMSCDLWWVYGYAATALGLNDIEKVELTKHVGGAFVKGVRHLSKNRTRGPVTQFELIV